MRPNPRTRAGPSVGWPTAESGAASYASLVAASGRAANTWLKASEALANGMFAISHEMLQFGQTRFREDVDTQMALGRCQSPNEAFDCQRRFTERATAQYLEAAERLASLMTKMASESLTPAALQGWVGEEARSMTREPSYRSPRAA